MEILINILQGNLQYVTIALGTQGDHLLEVFDNA